MSDEKEERDMFRKVGQGGYSRDQHVAQDLVEGGSCSSYDEAYELLDSMRSGEVVKSFRGHFRKE